MSYNQPYYPNLIYTKSVFMPFLLEKWVHALAFPTKARPSNLTSFKVVWLVKTICEHIKYQYIWEQEGIGRIISYSLLHIKLLYIIFLFGNLIFKILQGGEKENNKNVMY